MNILFYIACITIVILSYLLYKTNQKVKDTIVANQEQIQENNMIDQQLKEKQQQFDDISQEILHKKQENSWLEEQKRQSVAELARITTDILEQQQRAISEAQSETRQKIIEQTQQETEKFNLQKQKLKEEYQQLNQTLEATYNSTKSAFQFDIAKIQEKLDDLNNTYNAIVAARIKEKEIAEKLDFYCLQLSESDCADVEMLESIKQKLNKPRILSMLIWSTFFQKKMTTLCNNVLGTAQVTGIYKITNRKTSECYIGQAINIADRFKEHAKCGLDIDRPQGNKLYEAMRRDGLQNFSWELLEQCPRDKLNEKEKYYIELYKSADYGYNTLKSAGR